MSTQWGKNKATTKTEKYECTKKGNWERKCGKKKKEYPVSKKMSEKLKKWIPSVRWNLSTPRKEK